MDMTNKQTNKNNTMDKVVQGVASLGSERPEECNSGAVSSEDHPKTRVRYSGTARRRYKKQLQREREAAKAQISPPEADSNPGPSSGRAPIVAPKRARSGTDIPSPTETRQGTRDLRSTVVYPNDQKTCQTSPHFGASLTRS